MVPGRRATLVSMADVLPRRVYLAIGDVLTHRRFHPIHRRLYRWSGGRGVTSRALGVDMILVTMPGRQSGAARTVPLAAVRDGPSWIVVGSNAGKPSMPAWAHNLRDAGDVIVEHRAASAPFRAREAAGDERERCWAMAVAAYPGFEAYRARTTRPIPVFVLERLAPAEPVAADGATGPADARG
jgi:deazaflavin-dependent oxidoreductase (nitroreductase family)